MARKIMDNIILAILGGIGGAGGFTGLAFLFNAWRDSKRKDKELDSQLMQIAAKFNIEATNNATTLFSNVADRLDAENKSLRERVITLEVAKQEGDKARQERDKEIEDLKDKQVASDKQIATLTKNMETLSAESVKKDEVIHQQGEQIATLQTENKELKQRVKLLETAMEAANVPIPNGEDKHDTN